MICTQKNGSCLSVCVLKAEPVWIALSSSHLSWVFFRENAPLCYEVDAGLGSNTARYCQLPGTSGLVNGAQHLTGGKNVELGFWQTYHFQVGLQCSVFILLCSDRGWTLKILAWENGIWARQGRERLQGGGGALNGGDRSDLVGNAE